MTMEVTRLRSLFLQSVPEDGSVWDCFRESQCQFR
jgi:Bacterial cell division membrane protein